MSYCTYSDVAKEFKSITFSSSTAVTDSQVTAFIAQADAVINAKIGLKYAMPITDTDALTILKMISVGMVADRVRDIVKTQSGDAQTSQQARPRGGATTPASPWAMLDSIVKGDMLLGSAALASSADGVKSGMTDGSSSAELIFDVDETQW